MVSIGIIKGLKLFVRSDQGIDQIYGVLKVYIIISRPVNQQVISFELVDMGNRTIVVISGSIELGSLQITLGINRVVIPPGRHRSYCNGGLKTSLPIIKAREDMYPP